MPKKKSPRVKSARLSASDWVDAGLTTLARRGVGNVRVELLARDLKVTKGSFYWHFKDRQALLDAMLTEWRERALAVARNALAAAADDPLQQLRALMHLPQTTPDAAENVLIQIAVQLWARRDRRVHDMYEELQQGRLRFMTELVSRLGVDRARQRPLAAILAAVLYNLWVTEGRNESELEAIIELIVELVSGAAKPT